MKTEVLSRCKKIDYKKRYVLDLIQFYKNTQSKTGLCYLRGRKRVGKSTLLLSLRSEFSLFYFSGKLDEGQGQCIQRFAIEWSDFSQNELIKKIKKSALTWDYIFEEMADFSRKNKLRIAFDEIQWIAKKQSGFIGSIKNIWHKWEKTKNISLIICGSSNKFFHDYTGGEEQILRGLKTRADITVLPLTLADIKKNYFPKYHNEEIIFIYFLTGGIPYYLNQIPQGINFIQAINQTFFNNDSIFQEEADEVLRLEFNKAGIVTIKKILSKLGMRGSIYTEIENKLNISTGNLNETIEKLIDYKIIFERESFLNRKLKNKRGIKLLMKDFYLNFFFQIIKLHIQQIKTNYNNALLINSIFNWPQKFYYVPNFSGESFENVIEAILNNSPSRKEKIFSKLHLQNVNYSISTYFDHEAQIDLVIHEASDQEIRFLECKWTSSLEIIKSGITSLKNKATMIKVNQPILLAIAIAIKATPALTLFAKKNGVILIEPLDLF